MAIHQDFEDLLRCFNAARVRYLLVGAYAVSLYTEPRYTKDVDILVDTAPENAERVLEALQRFGAPVRELSVDDLTNPELVYQIGVAPVRIDIMMGIDGVDFVRAWPKRKTVPFGKTRAYVLALDDLIKAKRASARPQDRLDLQKLSKARAERKRRTGR